MKSLSLLVAAIATTPALAQSAGYYSARPAVAPAKATLVTRSTVWKCADGRCAAPRGGDRDTVLCELVAQRAGRLDSFVAGGTAFTPEALARCNARAK